VASLHLRVFATEDPITPQLESDYQAYFTDVYLENPCRDRNIHSLVYEEDGKIAGFLGVVPRRMEWMGDSITAAVATNFAVAPESRGMAGLKLTSAFLAGEHDISIADVAGQNVRRLWEGMGGRSSIIHSVNWLLLLSPARAILHFLGRRRGFSSVSRVLRPAASMSDVLARRLPKGPFLPSKSLLAGEPLDTSLILLHSGQLLKRFPLRVVYDEQSLAWLLRRAQSLRARGNIECVMLRTPKGKLAGWYIYNARPRGIGEVLQVAGEEAALPEIFSHLCSHAAARGIVGLAGRLERGLLGPLSQRFCLFNRQATCVLVHSRRSELTSAFLSGDVFFSMLDGEWCLRFKS